jgi:hypothetical protein
VAAVKFLYPYGLPCTDVLNAERLTELDNAEDIGRAESKADHAPSRPLSSETSRAYVTSTEFCRVFTENMDSLHLLSLLLTADLTKAEDCFVSGLEDCVEGSYVFRDWARSWARRTIIQKAIRMLTPRKNPSTVACVPSSPASCSFGRTPDADYAIGSILQLEDFERFVFVMSVLEKYSDQDCCVLLGCSRQDIVETRMRALLHVAASGGPHTVGGSRFDSSLHEEAKTQMEPQF